MANWIRADIKRGKKRSTQVFAHRGKLIVEKLLGYLDESINDDWLTRIFSPRLTKSFLIVPTFANESIISSVISTNIFPSLLRIIHRWFEKRKRDDGRRESRELAGVAEKRDVVRGGGEPGFLGSHISFFLPHPSFSINLHTRTNLQIYTHIDRYTEEEA